VFSAFKKCTSLAKTKYKSKKEWKTYSRQTELDRKQEYYTNISDRL
jgi:hypothetical protein